MNAFSLSATLTCAMVLGGCGSLTGDPHASPVFATLTGQITNPEALPTPGAIRVAVVWRSEPTIGRSPLNAPGNYSVAEDVAVQPIFPASFRIDFNGPPPEAAMNTAPPPEPATPTNGCSGNLCPGVPPGPYYGYAFGALVVYADQNGNGKLDLVPENATSYVDRILGVNPDMNILYTEGTPPSDTSKHLPNPPLGYVLLGITPCPVPAGDAGPAGSSSSCVPTGGWLPFSTPYPISQQRSPLCRAHVPEHWPRTRVGPSPGSPRP